MCGYQAIGNKLELSTEYYRVLSIRLSTTRHQVLSVSQRYRSGIAAAYSAASSIDFQRGLRFRRCISLTHPVSPLSNHVSLQRRQTYDNAAESDTHVSCMSVTCVSLCPCGLWASVACVCSDRAVLFRLLFGNTMGAYSKSLRRELKRVTHQAI